MKAKSTLNCRDIEEIRNRKPDQSIRILDSIIALDSHESFESHQSKLQSDSIDKRFPKFKAIQEKKILKYLFLPLKRANNSLIVKIHIYIF